MNRVCEFKKIVTSFFGFIFSSFIGLCIKYFESSTIGIEIFFGISIYFLLGICFDIFVNDLHLESSKLLFVSLFKIKEIKLETIHISAIHVTPRGPRFKVKIAEKEYLCFYTEDNYEVLKKLILMNKVDTTLEELDRMVKYSVLPIKRRKKNVAT